MKKSFLLATFLTSTFGLWSLTSPAQVCFSPIQQFGAGWGPFGIVAADFNGDGKKDIAVANQYDDNISISIGAGNGTFGTPTYISGIGNNPMAIASADFNGDGKADLVTANYDDNTISVLLGNGTGGFGAPANLPVSANNPRAVAAGDFNGDNNQDLAVTYDNGADVSILIGNGTGGFAAAVNYNLNYWYHYSILVADVNGDGKSDLVIPSEDDSNVGVLMGNGNGTFQSVVDYYAGGGPTYVSWADMNSDGKKDLIVSSDWSDFYVLNGNGNGTFQSPNSFSASESLVNAVADFNGDGNLDVATPYMYSDYLEVYLGDGAGNFGSASYFDLGANNPYSMTWGDFNGDGMVDLATGNNNGYNFTVLLGSAPPTIVANASATTVCPGTSVLLSGSGAGPLAQTYTVTYDVYYANTISMPYSNCTNSYYGYYYSWTGFSWNDNQPTSNIVTNVKVEMNNGYLSGSSTINTQMNGSNYSSIGSSTYTGCPRNNNLTWNYNSPGGNYNIGGSNEVYFYAASGYVGLCTNTTWPAGVLARVTVTYTTPGSSYSWDNGVTDGVPFVPASTNTYVVTGTTAGGCTNNSSVVITVLPATSHALNTADATCICNGTADVTASGGTAPFQYSWSNGNTTTAVAALCAGNYSVTTTDAQGCSKISTFTINAAPSTTLATTSAASTCNCSGTADVTVTGGTGPYTYAWSNGATTSAVTGLCPGTYTITATDSYSVACSNSKVVTIANNPVLSFTTMKTNATCTASCNGGATVTVTGGTGPYTYAWAPAGGTSSAATGLCANTTYTITATDNNGCSNVGNSVVIGVSPMAISFVNTNANCSSSCTGTSTASASGGTAPYTFSWSNGQTTATATGLCGGSTHTVTVTDAGGCPRVATTVIGSNPIVTVQSFSNTPASCQGVCNGASAVTVTGGVGPYTYAWAPSGGTNASATGLCAGTTYTVTVRDANNCSSSSTTSVPLTSNYLYIDGIDTWNASCNSVCNGLATVYAYGGSGSYSYSWMPGGATTMTATGLCGDYNNGKSYTVVVTDAVGCKDTAWEDVWTDDPMNINFSVTGTHCASSCDGAAAITSITDGSGYTPYTYLWSNGATTTSITGLCAGTYSAIVTVTDSVGCKSTEDLTINNNNNGVTTDGFDSWNTFCNASCTGSAIGYIDQNSSNGPYTFMWSNGATTSAISNLCAGNYTFMVTDEYGCSDLDNVNIGTNSNLNYSANVTDASCEQVCNGLIALSNYSGGAGPYTYQWMPGGATTASISGLCSNTTYSVMVTDVNGCTKINTATINYNYSVNSGTVKTNASCSGICDGKDSAFASGGTPPYTYSWFPSGGTNAVASNLCAGNYTLTVTDSLGCKKFDPETINANSAPSVALTTSNVFCNSACSGTASALVSGGTMPYTYTWSNGATGASVTGLCAGPYTFTVKDAKGCVTISSFNISTISSSISLSASISDATCKSICNGMATITPAGGAGPYMYSWAPSGGSAATAVSLCAGNYTVTVTDVNGCSKATTVKIDEPAALMTNVTVTNPTSCIQGDGSATANVTGGTAPYTYAWTPGGQITQTAVTLADGTYSVTITDANGCSAAGTAVVSCTSGINELAAEDIFSVSPNPTHGNLVVNAATGVTMDQISVDNVLGQTIFTTANSKHHSSVRVDLTAQPAGIYLLSVKADGAIYTQKIIKE